MQTYFEELANRAQQYLRGNERYTAWFAGENSEFCRLNGAKIRQAGHVRQAYLKLRLIDGRRNVEGNLALSGELAEDEGRLKEVFSSLRELVQAAPEDPYLLYNETPQSSTHSSSNTLPDARATIAQIAAASQGSDLVGIYASGSMMRGFANSLGQRNWFESHSFNFDFSLYLRGDKAVKSAYAGFSWDEAAFANKLAKARRELAILDRSSRELKPGRYRVYLAPAALQEVTDMLCWGGFSEKARRTKHSPLLKVYDGEVKLSPQLSLRENTAQGIAPDFNAAGYVKPGIVPLITHGVAQSALVSARTAQEYTIASNGADGSEAPESLEMDAGSLREADAAALVGDGLYVNNLWYLNFSDRPACRVTGMTRFATFWVERGQIVAPVPVMRFDESVLRMFGEQLVGLTAEQEYLMSASTYGQRATSSRRLPGALVDDFAITL